MKQARKKDDKAKKEPEAQECTEVHIAPVSVEIAKVIGKRLGMNDLDLVIGYTFGLTMRLLDQVSKGRIILARDRSGEQRDVVIDVIGQPQPAPSDAP